MGEIMNKCIYAVKTNAGCIFTGETHEESIKEAKRIFRNAGVSEKNIGIILSRSTKGIITKDGEYLAEA